MKPETERNEAIVRARTKKDETRLARGPLGVGSVLGRVLKPALGRRGLSDGALYARWADVVGPEFARYASPVKIARPADGPGVLHLRLTSGSAAALLHHQTPAIIARINQFYGREAIGELRVMQGLSPKTQKPVAAEKPKPLEDQPQVPFDRKQALASIDDPDLKAALSRLDSALSRKG